jgi:hypothetical protein
MQKIGSRLRTLDVRPRRVLSVPGNFGIQMKQVTTVSSRPALQIPILLMHEVPA